jgi:hypothetical protein
MAVAGIPPMFLTIGVPFRLSPCVAISAAAIAAPLIMAAPLRKGGRRSNSSENRQKNKNLHR